ncbi:MAG: tyrosine-type recombinase/integrase, partial [Gammaproteobacteria bacterium]
MAIDKLSDTQIRNVRPREKIFRLHDGLGLYLEVTPTGNRWWRFKYTFGGKEKRISLGVYPQITLKDARERRDEARRQLAHYIDPVVAKREAKAARVASTENTFEAVAREWFAKRSAVWKQTHSSKVIRRLEIDVFPWLGPRPIAEIKATELLQVVRRIEDRGVIETAHRCLMNCGQVLRYAIATGRAERDLSQDLRGALAPYNEKHFATIVDPKQVGALMRAIDGYKGAFITKCALQLAPLTFVRPGELRMAVWQEFDLDNAEWRIPAERMKMKATHIVPLARQAVAVLRELHPVSSRWGYVFPGVRTRKRPMSENTVTAALRRLGYGRDEMTGHGFRSMACTLLNEQGWNRDAIERQLAHSER